MSHSLFSPSAAHRWIACPGSMAWPGNTEDGESSVYADDGTASHHWGAEALKSGFDVAEAFLGQKQHINGVDYECDEERADFVQVYVDKVRQLAIGGILFVEHWVDLSDITGEGQGGTADAGVILPEWVTAADLKYGTGERVDAAYMDGTKRKPNQQLALYAAGLIRDARLLGIEPKGVTLCIVQPRLNHISEEDFTVAEIEALAAEARVAVKRAGEAMIVPRAELDKFMEPGDKTCRWCRAKAECPKLQRFVADQVRQEFTDINEVNEPVVPTTPDDLSAAGRALPLVMQWCRAVQAAISESVTKGVEIIGVDGKPLKFVEGTPGDRKWVDAEAAEAALVAVIGPEKAYKPRAIISAPQAAKILDKKKTKEQWKDQFEPMIKRAPGRPVLALGSDPRPAYANTAGAHEFDEMPDIGAE